MADYTACQDFTLLIDAAIDGTLSAQERQSLMEHLSACPACRERYQQSLLIHQAFLDWEEPELPGDLTAAVMAQVRREAPRKKRRPYRSLAAAAACLALVVLGARLLPLSGPENAVSPASDSLPIEEDADAALYDSAAEGIPSAVPEVRSVESASEEQIMEGVITYFNNAPSVTAADNSGEELFDNSKMLSAAPLSVPTLSSSDPELLSWMNTNIAEVGYNSEDTANAAGATAWLITTDEYEALTAHIAEVSMDYEMDWGPAAAVTVNPGENTDGDHTELICVVYLQAAE